MRRCALLVIACCLLTATVSAETPWAFPAETGALHDGAVLAEITAQAEILPPLDDGRLADFNALIGHLRLNLYTAPPDGNGRTYGIEAAVDQSPCAAMSVTEPGDGERLLGLPGFDSLIRDTGDEPANGFLSEATSWDLMMLPDLYLADADLLLERLLRTEGIIEKKDRQTIRDNFGKTTRRLTLPATDGAAFGRLLRDACPDSFLADFLGGLTFSGEQELYMLSRDDGFAVKAAWTGTVLTRDGTARKYQLEWKRIREDANVRDVLTCSNPGKSGNMKFTFDRRAKKQGGRVSIELKDCTFDGVMPDGQAYRLTVAMKDVTADESGWSGTVTLKDALVRGKKATARRTLTLQPAAEDAQAIGWRLADAASGQIWSGLARIRLNAADLLPALPETQTDPERLGLTREAILDTAGQVFGTRVLAALILLPDPADTAFLREGLDDRVWQTVLDLADE